MVASDVSLREAAEILGVHYMTAYRHVRTGRLPARLVGGEWRIDRTDLQAAGQRSPAPRSPRRPGTATTCRRLGDRLVAGDEAGAWSLIQDAMVGGLDPVAVHMELLAPTMRSIGDQWESGGLSVGDEHRATSVAQRLVGRLGPRFVRPGRTRGAVVLAGAAGDPHSLPIAMAADVVRAAGYAVVDLGCDVPPDSLALAAVRADRLVAVGINAATAGGEDAVRQAVAVLRATVPDVAVLVGGRAMDADLAAAIGADGFAPDAVGLVRVLDELRSPA